MFWSFHQSQIQWKCILQSQRWDTESPSQMMQCKGEFAILTKKMCFRKNVTSTDSTFLSLLIENEENTIGELWTCNKKNWCLDDRFDTAGTERKMDRMMAVRNKHFKNPGIGISADHITSFASGLAKFVCAILLLFLVQMALTYIYMYSTTSKHIKLTLY